MPDSVQRIPDGLDVQVSANRDQFSGHACSNFLRRFGANIKSYGHANAFEFRRIHPFLFQRFKQRPVFLKASQHADIPGRRLQREPEAKKVQPVAASGYEQI